MSKSCIAAVLQNNMIHQVNQFRFILSDKSQRARFPSNLHQYKPSFGIKIALSGLTKDAQWRISAEKLFVNTVIVAPDLIEYAFEGVFL